MTSLQKTSLIAEADYFYKKSELSKANELYSRILDSEKDLHCLLYRAYCFANQAEYKLAMKDIEDLIKLDNKHFKGLLLKANVLFDMGEFEYALIAYNEASKCKNNNEDVCSGQFKCKSAILSLFNAASTPKVITESDNLVSLFMPDFSSDFIFLTEISTLFKESKNSHFSDMAEDGLNFITKRLDFWKNYKQNDQVSNSKLKEKAKKEIQVIKEKKKLPPIPTEKKSSLKSIDKPRKVSPRPSLLETPWKSVPIDQLNEEELGRKIRKAFEKEEYQQVKHLCEEFLKRSTKISDRLVASRYCDVLLDYAHCLLEINEPIELSKSHAAQAKNISKVFQLHSYYPRSLNILGKCFAKSGKNEKAIKLWEERMKFDSTPVEKAWIYHDLGVCYLEMGKVDKSKECGKLSLEFSDQMGSRSWSAASKVLLGKCCEAEGHAYDAVAYYEKAVKSARASGDKVQLSALEQHLTKLRATLK